MKFPRQDLKQWQQRPSKEFDTCRIYEGELAFQRAKNSTFCFNKNSSISEETEDQDY